MAILQGIVTSFNIQGDGASTSYTVDIKQFVPTTLIPNVPTSVISITSGSGPVSSSSLAGTLLTINFTTAPGNGNYSVSIVLGY